MKHILLAFVTASMGFGPFAHAALMPKEAPLSPTSIYLPGTYESSTDIIVVENGYFPNNCYQWGHVEVTHPTAFIHEVKSLAVVNAGNCISGLIPYSQGVSMGPMVAGSHSIRFMNPDGTYLEKTLNIEK